MNVWIWVRVRQDCAPRIINVCAELKGQTPPRNGDSLLLNGDCIEISKSICYEKPVELQSTLFFAYNRLWSRHNASITLTGQPPRNMDIHLELYCASPTHAYKTHILRSNTRSPATSHYTHIYNIYMRNEFRRTGSITHIWIIRDTSWPPCSS